MSLHFILGSEKSNKKEMAVKEIVTRAAECPNERFFVMVPEQATLSMQRSIAESAKRGAVMNIDVVSFMRLAEVVLGKLGIDKGELLSDTDKVLLIKDILERCQESLGIYKKKSHQLGFACEIKTILTEFEQYEVTPATLDRMIESAETAQNIILAKKIRDLKLIFEEFLEKIRDKFATSAGIHEIFAQNAHKENMLKGCHIYLIGYTGFTPVQSNALQSLLRVAEDVTVVLTLPKDKIDAHAKDYDLFALSNRTYFNLRELAIKVGSELSEDAFANEEERAAKAYLFEAQNPKEEVSALGKYVRTLVKEDGLRFREIGVICADADEYYPLISREFSQNHIPAFIDAANNLLDNPLSSFIVLLLECARLSFEKNAVFGMLKSGVLDLDKIDICLLENYVLQYGIRGEKMWSSPWSANSEIYGEKDENGEDVLKYDLEKINEIRELVWRKIGEAVLKLKKSKTAADVSSVLLECLEKNNMPEKMAELSNRAKEEGRLKRAEELLQSYESVCEILKRISIFYADGKVTLKSFEGLYEIAAKGTEVGVVPPSLDNVYIGDLTRSRFDGMKAVLILGANEGKLTSLKSPASILSSNERRFLAGASFELAPSPEKDLCTQNFYLYLAICQPMNMLYISWSNSSLKGEKLSKTTNLDEILGQIAPLSVQKREKIGFEEYASKAESAKSLAKNIRSFAADQNESLDDRSVTLIKILASEDPFLLEKIANAAFYSNTKAPLKESLVKALYGEKITGSVSRFETFNTCAFKHFLRYGLRLKERDIYDTKATDIGTLYHEALRLYAEKLKSENLTMRNVADDESHDICLAACEEALSLMKSDVLYSSARNKFLAKRVKEVTLKTTDILREHVKTGKFEPEYFEVAFNQKFSEGSSFTGKIDRVDIYDCEDLYIKVIDFKSGNKKFDIKDIYLGTGLQLVAYLNAAKDFVKKECPDKKIHAGGLYYYLVKDNYVEEGDFYTRNQMEGISLEDENIKAALDENLANNSNSNIIKTNNDSIISEKNFDNLSEFVSQKIKSTGEQIFDGRVDINPVKKGSDFNTCDYCEFKEICNFEIGKLGGKCRELDMEKKEIKEVVYGDKKENK